LPARGTARFDALYADRFLSPAQVLATAEQPSAMRDIGRWTVEMLLVFIAA